MSKETSSALPIERGRGLYMDSQLAREAGLQLSRAYCLAEPYPHIVIDNFLPVQLIDDILQKFPSQTLSDDRYYEGDYAGHHKRQIYPESCDEVMRNVFHFFNSAPMLQFLEGVTSIQGLIGDPYFNGGGFHEIARGGKLGIHADFRINEQLHLLRRINLLIYLNIDWKEEYGGHLEIWDQEMKSRRQSILPVFNRCVIFNTDAHSYHGHPDPLNCPQSMTRKSMALYYYTASKKIYEDMPAHSTMYVARPDDSAAIKRQAVKLRSYNYLKDLLPPIAFRAIGKIRSFIKR